MQQAYGEFRDNDVEVVAISIDGVLDAFNMITLVGAEFPILPDTEGNVVRQYGVYNLLGDGVGTPATFIIGEDGAIRWSYVSQDIADLPSADDILLRLRELGL